MLFDCSEAVAQSGRRLPSYAGYANTSHHRPLFNHICHRSIQVSRSVFVAATSSHAYLLFSQSTRPMSNPNCTVWRFSFVATAKPTTNTTPKIPTMIPLVTPFLCCCITRQSTVMGMHIPCDSSHPQRTATSFEPGREYCQQWRMDFGEFVELETMPCIAYMAQWAAQCSSSHSQHIRPALGDESHVMMCHTAPIPTKLTILCSNKPNNLAWFACRASSVH